MEEDAGGNTPSSSSDFYNDNILPGQGGVSVSAQPAVTHPNGRGVSPTDQAMEQDNDASSDMDTDSSRSSPEPVPMPSQSQLPLPLPLPVSQSELAIRAGTKRRLSDGEDVTNMASQMFEESSKKQKRDDQKPANPLQPADGPPILPLDKMPAEYWQHIFLYLSPAELSRCLQVCKQFNSCLTKLNADPTEKKYNLPLVRMMNHETMWTQARKNFFPNLPRPFPGCTELQMLQLLGGSTCELCGKEGKPLHPTTQFDRGPGPDGLRVIWPFGVRSCGSCLRESTLRDTDILLSPAGPLRMGLPYAFLTPDQHFVPAVLQRTPPGIPSNVRATKNYFKRDVISILEEHKEVQEYGSGTADEWVKGLVSKGKDQMDDARRWEAWEQNLSLGRTLIHVLREYDPSSFPRYFGELQRSSVVLHPIPPLPVANGITLPPKPTQAFQNGVGIPPQLSNVQYQQVHRQVRDPLEVERIRKDRRAEIELRCMQELHPPIMPEVLQHMSAFHNAMQITQPMNDASWAYLKVKILEQREYAETTERQRQATLAVLSSAKAEPSYDDLYFKPAREVYDKSYENAQGPLREKLGEYADEYITNQWNGATALDNHNSPSFASGAIMFVHNRYKEDKRLRLLPTFEPPAKGSSQNSTPPPEPFLSLDNMKWVFDNKIRPLTDKHRRELFICAECTPERKPKWFAFEGLIQHVGAKHTTAFSKANVVVVWQISEWPEDPPFHQNPSQFVRSERRASDHRINQARPRNTPQGSRDAPFPKPGNGALLSNNPYFSTPSQQAPPTHNGYSHALPEYAGHQYSQTSPQYGQYGYPYQTAAPTATTVDVSWPAQVDKLAEAARETWDILDGVNDLLSCVRVYTTIHHASERFAEHFKQKPTLDLLDHAVAMHQYMMSIKNATGLACKICVASSTDGSANYKSYFKRIANVKSFNVASLTTHFKLNHQANASNRRLDWSRDMIELPETQYIEELIRTPGMDDSKLAIIAAAFPDAFPRPLPKIGVVQEPPPAPDTGLASRMISRIFEKKSNQSGKKKRKGGASTTPRREESEPLPEPNEDEYDPRRPMFIKQEEDVLDPARFDTDVARKTSASRFSHGGGFNLAPETVTALNSLNALAGNNGNGMMEIDDAPRRTPPGGSTARVEAPDISAILATLQGGGQRAATPPTIASSRTGSAPHQPYADPYGVPATSRYAGAPSPTYAASPPNVQMQHTLSRNREVYEQNRSYARSPPRVRYVYGEPAAYSPPQHPPPQQYAVHDTPVQWVQVPSGTGATRPPQPMTYLDSSGRRVELIPIDAAPAPVQYAPHPFEQQQHGRFWGGEGAGR